MLTLHDMPKVRFRCIIPTVIFPKSSFLRCISRIPNVSFTLEKYRIIISISSAMPLSAEPPVQTSFSSKRDASAGFGCQVTAFSVDRMFKGFTPVSEQFIFVPYVLGQYVYLLYDTANDNFRSSDGMLSTLFNIYIVATYPLVWPIH